VLVMPVRLGEGVGAWFTGRHATRCDPLVGAAGNLSHRRPHLPYELARDRAEACRRMGFAPDRLHLMRQVHGREVALVTDGTPPGAELRGYDALVTTLPGRPLAVQVADCVPVLLAGPGVVAAVHAGRRGVACGVVPRAVAALRRVSPSGPVRAAIGPAIGGCCYEVPDDLRDQLAESLPEAAAETTWGTAAIDLRAAVESQLSASEVEVVDRVASCTRCDPERRWFSHRADPGTGRQLGVVVLAVGQGAEPRDEVAA